MKPNIRIGYGYDVHALAEGVDFWIGGIKVPHTHGAFGHSDADVLIHVICDALLGAANMRDIGFHFSDKDPQYKGIDSKILLRKVVDLLNDAGYGIVNIDATVCLQLPKLSPHIEAMKKTLAQTMDIPVEDVSVKATTTEKLGFVGKEEGVAAHAVALIYKKVMQERPKLKLITTQDGSHSLMREDLNETYHSFHGAMGESKYVFIEQGLDWRAQQGNSESLKVFEVGFGTGLNAYLAAEWAVKKEVTIEFHSVEPFPVPRELYEQFNYAQSEEGNQLLQKLHDVPLG